MPHTDPQQLQDTQLIRRSNTPVDATQNNAATPSSQQDTPLLANSINKSNSYSSGEFDITGQTRNVFKGVEADDPQFNLKLSDSQSGWDVTKNALAGFGKLAVAGVLDGLDQWNLGDAADMMTGVEKDYSSPLHDLSNDIRDNVQQNNPIYEKNPGGFSPLDPAYWANQFQQVGYSAGLALEAVGEQAAIGALTGGTGNEVAFAKDASMLERLGSKVLSRSGRQLVKDFAFGSFKGFQEGYLNGKQTFEEEKKKLMSPEYGFDDAESTRLASKAASEAYRREVVPMMLLNGLQYGLMSHNPVTKESTGFLERTLGERGLLGKAAVLGTEMFSEGFEEMYQNAASEEGKNIADVMAGLKPASDFSDRAKGYLTSADSWNQFVGGALGGAFFTGVSAIKNKLFVNQAAKIQEEQYDYVKNNLDAIRVQGYDQIAKLHEDGRHEEAQIKKRNLNVLHSLELHHLDQINGAKRGEGVFDDNLSFYQNTLDAVNNNDTAQLTELSKAAKIDLTTEEGKQGIKDTFPGYIDDAKKVQAEYNKMVEQGYDNSDVAPLAIRHFMVKDLETKIAPANSKVVETKANMPSSPLLSTQGNEILDLSHQQEALVQESARISSLIAVSKDATKKEFLEKQLKQVADSFDVNNKRVDEISDSENYTPETKDSDANILETTSIHKPYIAALSDRLAIGNKIAEVRNEISLFDSSKWKGEQEIERVKNAKTQADLDAAKRRLEATPKKKRSILDLIRRKKNKTVTEAVEETKKDSKPASNPAVTSAIEDKEAELKAQTVTSPTIASLGTISTVDESPEDIDIAGAMAFSNDNNIDGEPNENAPISASIATILTHNIEQLNKFEPEVRAGDYNAVTQLAQDISNGAVVASDETVILATTYPSLLDNQTRVPQVVNIITPSTSPEQTIAFTGIEDDDMFNLPSPISSFTDEQKESLRSNFSSYVEVLTQQLGVEPSFEDLVRDMIKNQGRATVESLFNGVSEGWKLIGKTADFQAAYNHFFRDTRQISDDITKVIKAMTQSVSEDGVVDSAITNNETSFTEDNEPVYVHSGFVTHEEAPILAFVNRRVNTQFTKDAAGNIRVSKEYAGEIENNTDVDSLSLLDYDRFYPGTPLTVARPTNFMDIKISIFDNLGKPTGSETFAEYVRRNNLTSDMEAYQNRIPLMIYDENGNPVAFVRDIDRINGSNFDKSKGDISKAKANNLEIRKAAIEADGGHVATTITDKRYNTFEGLKLETDKGEKVYIPISEANPDAVVVVGNDQGELMQDRATPFPHEVVNLFNKRKGESNVKAGKTYDLRRFGLNAEGKPTYMLFESKTNIIDSQTIDSIMSVVGVYLNRDNKQLQPNEKERYDGIRKQILDKTGVDIYDKAGMTRYLDQFMVPLTPDTKFELQSTGNKGMDKEANTKAILTLVAEARFKLREKNPDGSYSPANKYFYFMQGTNIVVGHTQKTVLDKNVVVSFSPAYLAKDIASREYMNKFLSTLRNNVLPTFYQSTSLDAKRTNKAVAMVDKSGRVGVVHSNYDEFLKSRLQSNIKSVKLDNGKYVSTIQPMITYELDTNLNKSAIIQSLQVPATDNNLPPTPTNDEIARLMKEAEASTAWIGSDDEDYLPFGDVEGKQLAATINRIAGLTPAEQSHLVNFIYNQVQLAVDFDSKDSVSKDEVSTSIRKIVDDHIKPIRYSYQSIKTNLQTVYDSNPEAYGNVLVQIKKQDAALKKLDAVEAGYNQMEEDAYAKVLQYTGISQDKVDDGQENKIQEGEDNERSFSSDSLTEDGDAKSSYRLRRFFAGIENPKAIPSEKFLGLPAYVGFPTVNRTVKAMLSNIEADYDTMKAKLMDSIEAKPWIEDLVSKLEKASGQMREEFTSYMSTHPLNMEFVMYSLNRETGKYYLKVYNTNANAVTQVIQKGWIQNFKKEGPVAIINGEYILDKVKAKQMLDEFDSWTNNYPSITNNIVSTKLSADLKNVKVGQNVLVSPDSQVGEEIEKALAKSPNGKAKINSGGGVYFIEKADSQYRISLGSNLSVTKEQAHAWLEKFGINLSNDGMSELYEKGYYVKRKQMLFRDMFNVSNETAGIFGLLAYKLGKLIEAPADLSVEEDEQNPLIDSGIKRLAGIEAKYNISTIPGNFRDGGKSINSFIANKYITDRVRDLKADDGEIRNQILSTSFGSESMWLDMLKNSDNRDKFAIVHLGLTAFKELGKRVYSDSNNIGALSDADHELTKLGMFMAARQGKTNYQHKGFGMRIARLFSPTMSDKSTMTVIKTAVYNLTNSHFGEHMELGPEVVELIYNQTVLPELKRITNFLSSVKQTNIKSYDKGASMFMMMPSMNTVKIGDANLIDVIKQIPDISYIEQNHLQAIKGEINRVVQSLYEKKMKIWQRNGYLTNSEVKFLDASYLRSKGSEIESRNVEIGAMDFIINSMIANANSFMAIAGDPAIYYKKEKNTKENNYVRLAKDSFVNIGKRLANQIAPGVALSDNKNNNYIQVFLSDRTSPANNLAYLTTLYGEDSDIVKEFSELEATDAQEYHTWKEHLYILEKLGKLPDIATSVSPEEIREAREIFASGRDWNSLFAKEKAIVNKVAQPIKPVYTGQKFEENNDLMRVIYIKTSSFPLIPQLTKGLEIDKLREAMQDVEDKQGKTVRASYQTGNKVGAVAKSIDVWDENGKALPLSYQDMIASSLELSRKGFRIQQDVPYKSSKSKEDKVTLGTQTMKLLFGDGILEIGGKPFSFNGEAIDAKSLHAIYNTLFDDLINHQKKSLYNEIGLDENGVPVDEKVSAKKLQEILKAEAIGRDYGKQDIESLELDENGNFVIPLWAAANSDRYESLLNAIVTNRLIRVKMPGYSYVVGSEEGFRYSEDVDGVKDKSSIVFTDKWDGELKAAFEKGGELQYAQVLAPSKFRDKEGNIIDLLMKKDGEYVYVTGDSKTGFKLKQDMIDKELLSLTAFRIPTSGHVSMSQVEIVGFLPAENGDLMITPKNFTKQMGQDFDIDKLNTYALWHQAGEDGKIRVSDKGDEGKRLQNEIVKVHRAVLGSSSHEVQKKINKVLSIDFARKQAELIDGLVNGDASDDTFTALSDEYQKGKIFLGAAGKIGTGAYSLDVVGHSLFQQAALSGKPLRIMDNMGDGSMAASFSIGSVTTDGVLGKTTTLDGYRTISEVMAERQNIAVDNEKEQIMGRVNLNDITLDADKAMNILGFDRGEDGNSISMLLFSQPIVRMYVDEMRNAKSNISGYSPDKESRVINMLRTQYRLTESDSVGIQGGMLTNERMLGQLSKSMEDADSTIQGVALDTFLKLSAYGKNLRGVQTSINVDSKGLGKSFFEVLAKRDGIAGLASNKSIDNAAALIGDYKFINNSTTQDEIDALSKTGYMRLGNWMIKPTTLSGSFAVNSIATSLKMWSKHFPYEDVFIKDQLSEIVKITIGDEDDSKKSIDIKQDVFKEMKKYLNSRKANGVFDDLAQNERDRLFIDKEGHKSIATYISELKGPTAKRIVRENKLLNRFEVELNKTGKSIIRFNNAAGEDFDEDEISNSVINLLEKEVELPELNGKPYNTRLLAQDIIRYAYLEGGVQQAIQFVKHVPVGYLKTIGFAKEMAAINFNIHNIFGLNADRNAEEFTPSTFTMQYAQHNPERIPKFTEEQIKDMIDADSKTLNGLTQFKFVNEGNYVSDRNAGFGGIFLAAYNKDIKGKESKMQLYMYDRGIYRRVPVLGGFGMDEYMSNQKLYQSLINPKVDVSQIATVQPSLIPAKMETIESPFNIAEGNVAKVVEAISTSNDKLKGVADLLLPYINGATSIGFSSFDDRTVKPRGLYNRKANSILINDELTDASKISLSVLHETIHSLTANYINQFTDAEGKLMASAPPALHRLNSLFEEVRSKIGMDKVTDVAARYKTNITEDEISLIYPGINLDEFIAAAFTDTKFQEWLNNQTYKVTNKTLWDKFKELIVNALSAVVPSIKDNSALSSAISSILDVLDEKEQSKPSTFVEGLGNVKPFAIEDEGSVRDLRSMEDDREGYGDSELPAIKDNNKDNCI